MEDAMYTKVLVPVSLAEGADTKTAFELAKMFVGETGEVCALHVIETVPTFSEAYVPSEVTQQWESAAREQFEEAVPDAVTAREVLHGAAGVTILDYAKKIGADCIIVASHRPGLADYFLGSTAARVVRHAQCSVHVLR
jgi:nucleotide-binding universal stress UspA family protein